MASTRQQGTVAGAHSNGLAVGVAATPPGTVPPARLPRPPHRRRGGPAALGILLVVGSAAAAGVLAQRMDERVPVLVARQDLPVGHEIGRDDLATVDIAGSAGFVPAGEADAVIGRFVTQTIPGGRALDRGMYAPSWYLREGSAAVGLQLGSGRAPATGLEAGDRVTVIRTVDGEGTVLASDVVVSRVVSEEGDGGFGPSEDGGGDLVVTVIVPNGRDSEGRSPATRIAAAAAADQIAVVLLERGTVAGGG